MAQETAGTIGIPVLKNEVLPYLEYYSKRRENAAKLDAARQQKLAELEYKRQMEAEKTSIPSLPTPKGGYFTKIVDRDRNELSRSLVDAQQKGVGRGDLVTAANVGIQAIGSKDALNEFYTRQLDERGKRLNDLGFNVTPGLIQKFVDDSDATDPQNFFTKFKVEDFDSYVKSNTGLYNLPQVGTDIIAKRKVTPSKIKVNTAKGGEEFEYYPFFKIGQQKINGRDVVGPIDIDIDAAEELYNASPDTREYKNTWIAQEAKNRAKLDPSIAGILDPDLKQKKANEAATREFYKRSLSQFEQVKYGVIPPKTGGAGSKKNKKIAASAASLVLIPRSGTAKEVSIRTTSISPAKNTDLVFQVPSNTNVFRATDFSLYPLATGSLNLTDLNLGYAARNKNTGDYIKPKDWKNTLLADVEFVEGAYAVPETYQTKPITTGSNFFTSAISNLLAKPTALGERVFVPKGTVGAIESQARNTLREQGLNYNAEMARNLSDMKAKFKKSKFKTKH